MLLKNVKMINIGLYGGIIESCRIFVFLQFIVISAPFTLIINCWSWLVNFDHIPVSLSVSLLFSECGIGRAVKERDCHE